MSDKLNKAKEAFKESSNEMTLVLIKNYWDGLAQSAVWLLILAAFMSFAVWIGSSAMQWIMAFFWFVILVQWASGRRNVKRRTATQALKEIQKVIEGHE
ncbi:hypothetical protein [Pseudovibrio sp. SPO723]|uniref:hypothetical protein n=1 Tax=Nesiotobacter zosterae TaxID=392721 RepID=UPI0029C454A1|nr:hypothetical protein [Pseudovibrio sp. SPO723]MDX5592552.1 hypothetical protein [Pseudovibrio sp. SPO723]